MSGSGSYPLRLFRQLRTIRFMAKAKNSEKKVSQTIRIGAAAG